MNNRKSRLILSVLSIVALASLAGGCVAIRQEVTQGPAPVAAATAEVVEAAKDSPPAINSFGVTPASIGAGQSAVLSWDVSGARELTIAPSIASSGSSTIAKGSEQVSPSTTTTYILTAANDFGRITQSAAVTVTGSGASTGIGDRLVGFDPVSGRNDEIDLNWEQLCLASDYQVQIAKDADFSIVVLDTGAFSPVDSTSPGAYFPAGGQIGIGGNPNSAIARPGVLEAGHKYYLRFRVVRAVTGQRILSPWSETYRFTVKPGLPTSTPSYGPQLLYPGNGYVGCGVAPVSFSWTPYKDTMKYRFQLARDASMAQIMAEADVPTTAYEYQGTLYYGTSYYWRVMAVEPVPSDWSAVFTFHTISEPASSVPPAAAAAIPVWAWVVMAVGSVLVIAVVVLLVMAHQRRA